MAALLNPFVRALDANGDPVSGALLYVFEAGTTTPVTTYSDSSLSAAQAHPLEANSAGEFEQSFLESGSYKIRVSDADEVTLNETDNVRMAARPDDPVFLPDQASILADTSSYDDGTYIISQADGSRFLVLSSGATDYDVTNAGGEKLQYVNRDYLTVSELLSSNEQARGAGASWSAAGFGYVEAESAATDHHITIGSGVKLYANCKNGSVNVMAFGAISDATSSGDGTDNATFFQSAIDTGCSVFVPSGDFRVSSVTISTSGQKIFGDGMGSSLVYPIDTYSCFIVARDKIEVSDIEFIGKTGSDQYDATGDCIKFDAVTNDATFTRHMEGCKVERVGFRNLKMNGIYVPHLLRESHIRECRFVGVGDAATNRHGIKFLNSIGTGSNINNIWIDSNMFYRFNSAAIKGYRSTVLAGSAGSFADIRLTNNLIHGQLIDETGGGVEPEPTSHVRFQDANTLFVIGNKFTSVHPLHYGLYVTNTGTYGKVATVIGNHFATKTTVDGVTYSRDGANLATGGYVNIIGTEAISINNNEMAAGTFVNDITLSNGDYTSKISVCCTGNTSEAGAVAVSHSSLGAINSGWAGTIEQDDLIETTNDLDMYASLNVTADAVSEFIRTGNGLALRFKYDDATSGAFIGSPGANQFQVASNGGSPLFVVDSVSSTRPGADNSYSLGSASYRWSDVYSVNGTINTSDEREKQDVEELSDAEMAVASDLKGLIRKFKWRNSVAEKGDAARIHVGVMAQEVVAAFASQGLDAHAYGVLCFDEWEDQFEDIYEQQPVLNKAGEDTGKTQPVKVGERLSRPKGNLYGVRYEQLFAFIIAAM